MKVEKISLIVVIENSILVIDVLVMKSYIFGQKEIFIGKDPKKFLII